MTQPKLLLIEWIDAATTTGWFPNADEANPAYVWSVGFLAEENNKFIKIAQSISGGDFGDITVIPLDSVQKRRVLKAKL